MKILYLANARIPTEKAHGVAIMRACESFARAGADVTLVVPRRRTSSGEAFERYGVEPMFRITFLPTIDLYGVLPDKLAFGLQLLSFYTAAKLWLLFGSRDRTIYTRDMLPLFFAWIGYRVVLECHRIPNHRGFFFFAARRASRIIVISKALREQFVAAGFRVDNILVAPSGVDLETFDINISKEDARKKLDLPVDAHIAVYTGNFTTMGEDKGIADIITALTNAPDILFVAVGGSEADIAHYNAQAKAAGVGGRTILRGYMPQKVLAIYQKAADVLLMPFPDTPHYRRHMSPVKMFEYMASGRPIIASDLPTIREVLNDGNSILIPPGTPSALARALVEYSAADTTAVRASRAHVDVASYSWGERAKKILAFVSMS